MMTLPAEENQNGLRKIEIISLVGLWVALNLIQGNFTELTSDEGYYWFYSTSPEWGYYDHPPFLAWIIGAGYFLFQNELGVRLFNVLMNGAALFLFLQLIRRYIKKKPVAFLVILSMPLFHYISFIVFPDGPLIFFSIIFLLAYKRFLEKKDILSSVLMGAALAFMFYSKYHGVLILLFTVLSNPSLLRSGLFYLSSGIALLLFLPHIFWQHSNDYPTIEYHLSGRMSSFSISNLFQYISQQILVMGPALVFIPFVYKATDQFEKTLKYIVLGTFIFFLVASLRTFVHFHWTSIVVFPVMFLAIRFYSGGHRSKLLLWLTLPVIFFLLVGRIQLMTPVIPLDHVNVDYYHGRKSWANDIAKLSGSDSFLFQDNFREASLFSFYSKKTGVTLFSGPNRKSQYDLWHYEDSLQEKDLLYIRYEPFPGGKEFTSRIGKKIYYTQVSDFTSYYNVEVKASLIGSPGKSDSLQVSLDIKNPRQKAVLFRKDRNGNSPFLYYKIKMGKAIIHMDTVTVFPETDSLSVRETRRVQASVPVWNLKKGKYKIHFGFRFGLLRDSDNEEITVKKD
jgi:hypothetical protein